MNDDYKRIIICSFCCVLIQSIIIAVMSGQRNWNDMSSDQDEDSWFDSDEDNKEKQEIVTQPEKTVTQEEINNPVASDAKQQGQSAEQKQVSKDEHKPKRGQTGQRKKFLKDEELLVEYTNKTVDDPRVIKAVKVFNGQHKEILNGIKNARVKQVRDGIFILNFEKNEGLLQFIKEKIANRYRFFLQPYFKKKQDQNRGGRQERRERNEEKRRDRKPKSQDQRQDQQRRDRKERQEKRQPKESRRPEIKQQQKGKKTYLAKQCFQLENNKNLLFIKSEGFQIDKVIDQLEDKKVFKNFNKLRIKTPYTIISKVSKLITQIGSKYKFYLDKEPSSDTKKEDNIQLLLIENLQHKQIKVEKQQQKPNKTKETRPQPLPPPALKVEQVVHARKLTSNFDDYFSDVSKYNLSQIVKGFDQNEYIRRLKENSSTIFQKYWNSWKIEAEDQFIESLLKLTHRLKKSTLYDVDLKPSMRNLKPILTAELRPRPEKDRRPKVDVSGVNGYLS